MEVLRAEEQLEPPRVFLEWEIKTWLVDPLKCMKPWDALVFPPWGCMLSSVSQLYGLPVALRRAKW